jgi:hypothetical protein
MATMQTTIKFNLDGSVEVPLVTPDGTVIGTMTVSDNASLAAFLNGNKAVMGAVLSEDTAALTLTTRY